MCWSCRPALRRASVAELVDEDLLHPLMRQRIPPDDERERELRRVYDIGAEVAAGADDELRHAIDQIGDILEVEGDLGTVR